jgi:hypothetical protein
VIKRKKNFFVLILASCSVGIGVTMLVWFLSNPLIINHLFSSGENIITSEKTIFTQLLKLFRTDKKNNSELDSAASGRGIYSNGTSGDSSNTNSTKTSPSRETFAEWIKNLKTKDLKTKLTKLSEQISLLTSNENDITPDDLEKEIQDISMDLSVSDLTQLKELALDFQKEQDQRFMAAYMVAHGMDSVETTRLLQDILTAPIPEMKGPASKQKQPIDFELALRAFAAESLSQNPTPHPPSNSNPNSTKQDNGRGTNNATEGSYNQARMGGLSALQGALNKITHPFLLDRTQRSIYAIQHAEPVEHQDQKALEQLLSHQ